MQLYIHIVEEITGSAIEDYFRGVWREQMQLIHHRVLLPPFGKLALRTQSLGHIPIIRKRANIHSAAHTSASAENILMPKTEIQSAVAAHTQSGNRSALA